MNSHLQLAPQVEAQLTQMSAEAEQVNRETTEHWARPRSLNPEAAAFLSLLVRLSGSKRILEIGTSVGFSTTYLADAVRQNGGHVTSIDVMPEKTEKARQNLLAAGLSEYVALKTGDVREFAGHLQGPWDLVFIDLEKELYLPVWNIFSGEVRVGGVIVADNVISHRGDLTEFLQQISGDRRFETVTLPIGDGLELSRRLR